jgi:hypothetical protein
MPVTVSVDIPRLGASTTWAIEITSNGNYSVENIAFPSFTGLGKIGTDPDQDYLAYPKWSGILIKNPVNSLKIDQGLGYDNDYPSASNNMQFMAYYNTASNAGLYMSTNDTAGHRKLFNMNKLNTSNLQMLINHTPVYTTNSSITIPYKVQVGFFTGGWYEAAKKYRAEIAGAPWLSRGKLATTAEVPLWFKNTAYHSWIFTHPPEVPSANPFSMVPQISTELKTLLKAPGMIDWVGWENVGWYLNYPDVYPPKEGWTPFRNAVTNVHDGGNHLMTVSNVNSYSSTAPSFSTAQNAIMKGSNNAVLPPSSYTEGTNSTSLYTMCPATSFWKNKVAALTDTLALESIDAIQIDGFPLSIPVCYDATHGHPAGGGNWWFKEYYNLYKSIRAREKINNRPTAFSTEAMSEAFIPLFDAYWNPYSTGISPCQLQYDICSNVELIPLWQTVYHDYIITQSGISFYTPPAGEEDYYRRGLALVWGEVPTTFTTQTNYNNNPQSNLLAYFKQIVQARSQYANEFLVYGEMQKQLNITVPQFLNAGANGIPYTGNNYPAFYCPSVLTSSWKSPTGSVGHIFTNISNSVVAFSCQLPNYNYGNAAFDIIKIQNGSFGVLQRNTTLPFTANLSLLPNDVVIIKSVPASTKYIWTGTVSTAWNNAANWSPAVIPTINDDVIIPGQTPFAPFIANGINGFCKSIQVDPSANVTVATGGNLKTGL